ncbi:MAG: 30S ribosomal protein S21 [Candidatus Pacebacteria bacterium]|nr:30S ribosomal protein S21 [Candidatus Paceibacterota bacterium]
MITVIVKNNNIEKALRQLKKIVKESKLLIDLRKKEYYRKPSEIRREQRAISRLRSKKDSNF